MTPEPTIPPPTPDDREIDDREAKHPFVHVDGMFGLLQEDVEDAIDRLEATP